MFTPLRGAVQPPARRAPPGPLTPIFGSSTIRVGQPARPGKAGWGMRLAFRLSALRLEASHNGSDGRRSSEW